MLFVVHCTRDAIVSSHYIQLNPAFTLIYLLIKSICSRSVTKNGLLMLLSPSARHTCAARVYGTCFLCPWVCLFLDVQKAYNYMIRGWLTTCSIIASVYRRYIGCPHHAIHFQSHKRRNYKAFYVASYTLLYSSTRFIRDLPLTFFFKTA